MTKRTEVPELGHSEMFVPGEEVLAYIDSCPGDITKWSWDRERSTELYPIVHVVCETNEDNLPAGYIRVDLSEHNPS